MVYYLGDSTHFLNSLFSSLRRAPVCCVEREGCSRDHLWIIQQLCQVYLVTFIVWNNGDPMKVSLGNSVAEQTPCTWNTHPCVELVFFCGLTCRWPAGILSGSQLWNKAVHFWEVPLRAQLLEVLICFAFSAGSGKTFLLPPLLTFLWAERSIGNHSNALCPSFGVGNKVQRNQRFWNKEGNY